MDHGVHIFFLTKSKVHTAARIHVHVVH